MGGGLDEGGIARRRDEIQELRGWKEGLERGIYGVFGEIAGLLERMGGLEGELDW